MTYKVDLTGNRYGKLTVTGFSHVEISPSGQRKFLWKVTCDCGEERICYSSNLVRKLSGSCGCARYEKLPEEHLYTTYLFAQYSGTAKAKSFENLLTREDLWRLTQLPCHYCKSPATPRYSGKYPMFKYNGLDRVNNKLGYTLSNVVTCCHFCNRAKSDLPLEEFVEWLQRVRAPAQLPPNPDQTP